MLSSFLLFSYSNNMTTNDEDRKRRLRDVEVKIQDPRSIINVDCLIDAVQNIMSDCDHPAIRKIKNIDAFVSRCKSEFFCKLLCNNMRTIFIFRWQNL